MKEEVWKDIPDYEGLYQASNLERIRSLGRVVINGKKSKIYKPCNILKQQIEVRKKPYEAKKTIITLKKNNKRKTYNVARLVATTFYGKSDLTINHINGNTLDNRIDNLEWCSLEENIRKGFQNGLYNKKFTGVRIVEKSSGIVYVFESCASAGKYFGMSQSYWFRKNKDTKRFRWEIL